MGTILITPTQTFACAASSNITFTGDSDFALRWTLSPTVTNGAAIVGTNTGSALTIAPGNLTNRYTITAIATNDTNCQVTAVLDVLHVAVIPTQIVACASGSNVTFSVTSNSTQTVQWELLPELTNGAIAVGATNGAAFTINPGSIATQYRVFAFAADLTNCLASATLDVRRVTLDTNALLTCAADTNNAALAVTADSSTNIVWMIEPALTNGARFASDAQSAGTTNRSTGTNVWIAPGMLGTNYQVRAFIDTFTNCQTIASMQVFRVVFETNERFLCAADTNNVPLSITASTTNIVWTIEPDLGTNGLLFATNAVGPGVTNRWTGTNAWVQPGIQTTNYTIRASAAALLTCAATLSVSALDARFVRTDGSDAGAWIPLFDPTPLLR